MRFLFYFVAPGIVVFLCGFSSWQPVKIPAPSQSLRSLAIRPDRSDQVLVATDQGVFQKLGSGSWKKVWRPNHFNQKIFQMLAFPHYPESIFILTTDGIIEVNLRAQKAAAVYRSDRQEGKTVLSFTVLANSANRWLAGTEKGLYESRDKGKAWSKVHGFSQNEKVVILKAVGSRVFAGTERKLYISEDLFHFEEVFGQAQNSSEDSFEEDDMFGSQEATQTESSPDFISDLEISGTHCNKMWLGTWKGAFESRDCGDSWHAVSQSGMRDRRIRHMTYLAESDKLFASTEDGIYEWGESARRWQEHYQGLTDTAPRHLLAAFIEDRPLLLALTEDGLVRFLIGGVETAEQNLWIPSPERYGLFQKLTRLEPSMREIHEGVIRYANLSNNKIRRWHWQSRLRALIPSFSFNRDLARSNNIDLDRGSTSSPDVYIAGPDERDESWEFDIEWDLADVIWSSSQTSIDSREKLMVDLRHDLLTEATRIYHERRRLQMEIAFAPAAAETAFFDSLIRLDELTALLDAMTGGLMSGKIEEVYGAHPELGKLWTYPHGAQEHRNTSAQG